MASAWNKSHPASFAAKVTPVEPTGVAIKAIIVQTSYALLAASSARFRWDATAATAERPSMHAPESSRSCPHCTVCNSRPDPTDEL